MQTIKDLLKDKKLMKYSAFAAFTMGLIYIMYFIIKNLDVILGACFSGLGSLAGALSPLLIGILLAYILNPAVEFFNNKLVKKVYHDLPIPEKNVKRQKKQRLIAAAITYIVILATIVALIFIFFSLLVGHLEFTSLTKTIESLANYLTDLGHKLNSSTSDVPTSFMKQKLSSLSDMAMKWLSDNFNAASAFKSITSIGTAVINFVLGLVVSFWLVYDKNYFTGGCKKFTKSILPDKGYSRLGRNLKEIDYILSHFIRGICLDTVIIALLSSIVLSFCGLKYAVVIGVFAGFCNVIPYFGPIMGMIPAFIVGYMNGGIGAGLIPVICLLLVQQVDSNFIYPKVVGSSTGLHPLIVLLAVIVGGVYGGIVGMLIAVPIASILKLYAFKTADYFEARKKAKNTVRKENEKSL